MIVRSFSAPRAPVQAGALLVTPVLRTGAVHPPAARALTASCPGLPDDGRLGQLDDRCRGLLAPLDGRPRPAPTS